ncbi:MAG: thymidylate synthase [Cyanobacteria bacterium P01_H01_bin.35]
MNNTRPIVITEENLSYAWARIFLHIIDNPGKEIAPLVVSITGFKNNIPQEDKEIREALDNCLKSNNKQSVHTVANTIFPESLWRRSKYNRKNLFEMYEKIFPRIQALAKTKNSRGVYFKRLISFGFGPENGNQLEYVISQYNSRPAVRRTMLQLSIFDPGRDHDTIAQLPFPCLQHISLVPNNKEKSLKLNAFYATQQVFEKSYGNYLGLCRLGKFIASEMNLEFSGLYCFIGVAKMDTISKKKLAGLEELARKSLEH